MNDSPSRWRRLLRIWRRPAALDVDAELDFHLGERVDDPVAGGLATGAARAQALAEFGNVASVRSGLMTIDARIARRISLRERWEWVGQDLRYVLRSLRRSPGFVVTVSLTFALGLGVNAAVFSLIDRLFLRPPAGVENPGVVRRIYRFVPARDSLARLTHAIAGAPTVPRLDYPEFREIALVLPASAQLAGYAAGAATIGRGSTRAEAAEAFVAGDYFRLLGVHAARGRFFSTEELRPETPVAEAVISERIWTSRFGSRDDVVGATSSTAPRPTIPPCWPASRRYFCSRPSAPAWCRRGARSRWIPPRRSVANRPVFRLSPAVSLFLFPSLPAIVNR